MANQQTNKKFINGVFVKKVWQDATDVDNSLFGIGIKKEELLHYLNEAEEDERGFINWTMGSQKGDRRKLFIWENDFVPEKRAGGSNYNKASKPSYKALESKEEDTSDDLPF